jgi:hypothetical protein
MRWEVERLYAMDSLQPTFLRRPVYDDDTMTFQRWGASDPDNSIVVVALEQYEDFAHKSPRDLVTLLAETSKDSFALPKAWEPVSV